MTTSLLAVQFRSRDHRQSAGPGFYLCFATPVVVGFLCRLQGLDRPLDELFGFRQTQTAFTVREYMRSGIDLAHSPVPVLGPPWDIPFEFPLFQGIAAFIGGNGVEPAAATRLTGLICFEITCILLGVLAVQWFSRATAVIAVVIFQLTPFGVQWGWAALIEFLATAAAIGAVVAINSWVRQRRNYLLALAVLGQVIAFLVKPTTAMPWLIAFSVPAAATLLGNRSLRRSRPVLAASVLPPAVGVLCAALWTRYADHVKEESRYTEFVTSSSLKAWNFGTLDQRLDMSNWMLIIDRLPAIAGAALLLAGIAAVTVVTWRLSLPALAVVVLPVVAVGTFFNLYVIHDYYLCAVYPAIALLVAAGIAGVCRLISDTAASVAIGVALALAVVTAAWNSPVGERYHAILVTSPSAPALSLEIIAATSRSDGVILVNCDWNPTWLYYADRRGLMLRSDQVSAQVPARWLPSVLSFVGYCGDTQPSFDFLPPTVRTERVSQHLFAIRPVP